MKVIIHGYIENLWARRLNTYSQTLEVLGHIGFSDKMIISIRKYDTYTQPIKIEVEFEGEPPINYGVNNELFK